MLQLLPYPFKVWITSVLVGPVLLLFIVMQPDTTFDVKDLFGFVQFYLVAVLLGGFCSIPCFLFLWLCYSLLIRWRWTTFAIKAGLLFVSMLCCITVFACFSMVDRQEVWTVANLKLMIAFAIPLAFGVTLYKLKKNKEVFDGE
jgi:hypothetical protein